MNFPSSRWLPQHSAVQRKWCGLLLCSIEICRYLQADCCMSKQGENAHFSLWYVWYLLTTSKKRWWSFIVADVSWSGLLWLTFISPFHLSTQDPQQPRWSLKYSFHALPLCDRLTPAGSHGFRLISDHANHISISCSCMHVSAWGLLKCLYEARLLSLPLPCCTCI